MRKEFDGKGMVDKCTLFCENILANELRSRLILYKKITEKKSQMSLYVFIFLLKKSSYLKVKKK